MVLAFAECHPIRSAIAISVHYSGDKVEWNLCRTFPLDIGDDPMLTKRRRDVASEQAPSFSCKFEVSALERERERINHTNPVRHLMA